MKIHVEHGVLYQVVAEGNIYQMIGVEEADRIARANGFAHAEQIVKAFTGKDFEIDNETRKIKEISEDFV